MTSLNATCKLMKLTTGGWVSAYEHFVLQMIDRRKAELRRP